MQQNKPLNLPILKESMITYEESLITIKKDILQIGSAPSYPYYSLMTPPAAVSILAFTPEGDYIFIEEYRHPTGRILIGCPGGFIDQGETPLEAAERELREETGFKAKSYEVIGSAFPYAGFSGQQTIYVRALHSTSISGASLEPSEIIRPFIIHPQQFAESVATRLDLDGTLCTALFFHQLKI